MENIDFTFNGNAFHIEGFPDAVKILKITGPKGKRLADLALHKSDLAFSLECLKTINCTPEDPPILREVEAYPVDSGSPTCSVLIGGNRAATRTLFDGRRSFACPIPEGLS